MHRTFDIPANKPRKLQESFAQTTTGLRKPREIIAGIANTRLKPRGDTGNNTTTNRKQHKNTGTQNRHTDFINRKIY